MEQQRGHYARPMKTELWQQKYDSGVESFKYLGSTKTAIANYEIKMT